MTNSLQELQGLGQSVWFDNIRRGFIKSGELQRLIDLGVSGLTSNPSIFEKAITGSADYDEALMRLAAAGGSASEIFEGLAIEDIRDAADLLLPVYERTAGGDGFASIEVSPHLARDTAGTVAEARRLHSELGRPNVMIKVPATPEGIPAIRALIGEGINVNVTLIFSLDAYAQVRDAYIGGLEDLASAGGNPADVASVASFFVSRVDSAIDGRLEGLAGEGADELEGLMGKAAIANAKVAYRDFRREFASDRFAPLQGKGARVQRPLWASTSTKNPEYSDVLYVDTLIGRDTVNTMPDVTLTAFLEHGNPAADTIERDMDDAARTLEALEAAGISMRQVTDGLLADGVKAFADSYDTLIANIEDKRARLAGRGGEVRSTLGGCEPLVDAAIARLERDDVVRRMWERDHTVWKPDPTEIADRLGWLTTHRDMRERVVGLRAFADEIRGEGYADVVVLGMGGSSLGAEALARLFGRAEGFPRLRALDSTVPAAVSALADDIDCAKTLFVVASKSGSTIEPNMFYKHFRGLVERAVGADAAGRNFVAICDAGTALDALAEADGFRRTFINPPDIGGRYSVQSLFGLAPAALAGIDVGALLDSVGAMSGACGADVAARDNPGAWLGAAMGALAAAGRDKLTIITTPSLSGFGMWAEQLLAESTGKEGKGILPVAGEPICEIDAVGDDRLFVYARLAGDDAAATDAYADALAAAGKPVVRIGIADKHQIGGEFFRWEFATAVAGAVIGVNPFDQPDVQSAKDITARLLAEYQASGAPPDLGAKGSLGELLAGAKAGDYLAITAFVEPTGAFEDAIGRLRRQITARHDIATTLGYGPRYLHSTGQIHKGGANNGLHLQLTQAHSDDVAIPGERFTFGLLADAQAKGDLDALAARGRRVARVAVQGDAAAAVDALAREVGS